MTRHGAITRIDHPKGWGLIADGPDTRWFGAQGLSGGSFASLSVGDSVTFDLQPNPRPEKREQCPLVATNVKASTHALVRRGQSSHTAMRPSLSTQGLQHLSSKGNCETLKRVEEKKIHRADGSFVIERTEVTRLVFQPYGQHAGVTRFHKSIPRDQFGNVAGPEYDLSPDGTFRGQTILVMQLYTGEGFTFAEPKAALERKGFTVDVRTSLPELKTFCTVLSSSCQLWVVSGMTSSLTDGHCQAIQAFVNSGKGLFIWGDNDPYTADANALLRHLEQTNELSLSGNFVGDTNLVEAKLDGRESLKGVPGFTNHLVTTGLETLYEGITIAKVRGHPDHPVKQFKPLIRSSDGEVVTAFHDRNHVRIMIDGGYTRLYPDRWGRTAGTARFVTNAACWLYNHEARQAAEKSRGRASSPARSRKVEAPKSDDSLSRLSTPQRSSECRDGAGCSRFGCHFTHPPQRKGDCHYGAGCSRFGCRFMHPPQRKGDCRDGAGCSRFGCRFLHPR